MVFRKLGSILEKLKKERTLTTKNIGIQKSFIYSKTVLKIGFQRFHSIVFAKCNSICT